DAGPTGSLDKPRRSSNIGRLFTAIIGVYRPVNPAYLKYSAESGASTQPLNHFWFGKKKPFTDFVSRGGCLGGFAERPPAGEDRAGGCGVGPQSVATTGPGGTRGSGQLPIGTNHGCAGDNPQRPAEVRARPATVREGAADLPPTPHRRTSSRH